MCGVGLSGGTIGFSRVGEAFTSLSFFLLLNFFHDSNYPVFSGLKRISVFAWAFRKTTKLLF